MCDMGHGAWHGMGRCCVIVSGRYPGDTRDRRKNRRVHGMGRMRGVMRWHAVAKQR